MRVLVAEDDRAMSQLLCTLLMSVGHQPVPVYDGASAMMAAMRSPAPELVVLDMQMPAGDGSMTLAKLKSSSRTALIPVIVVSATQDLKVRESVRALGAATFMEKPIDPDRFLEAVTAFGPKKG